VFAEQLNNRVWMQVREAVDGDELQQGVALVAPGGCHLRLEADNRIRVAPGAGQNGYCPSIDLTMQSAALTWQRSTRGVLLTGLGDDGAAGLKEIRERGGQTFAQNAESCLVSHLPQHAVEAGVVDHIAPPAEIARMLEAF
jgi:two-component system chemotaxis response regulator CheB